MLAVAVSACRLALDDVAVIDVLAVPPIVEHRRRRVDVDPGFRRIAGQPAQPFHGDRELPRAIAGTGVQGVERVAADNPVLLEPELALQRLYGGDELRRVMFEEASGRLWLRGAAAAAT